tara:strand:- start:1382 stop:1699 length:318 start_codon:yes stop_codon:yes gene_type:complete
MNPISTLNRGLGQRKRKVKNDMFNGEAGCLSTLFIWVSRIAVFPFTLLYFGFLKRDVSVKWKLLIRILAIISWVFIASVFVSAAYNSSTKADNTDAGSSAIEQKY